MTGPSTLSLLLVSLAPYLVSAAITITQPAVGTIWEQGSTQQVSWSNNDPQGSKGIEIDLFPINGGDGLAFFSNLSNSSMTLVVDTNIDPGVYFFEMTDQVVKLASSAQFTVVVPGTQTTGASPTPSSTGSSPTSPSHKGSNSGAIAGGVVGGLALIALTALAIVFCLRRRRRGAPVESMAEKGVAVTNKEDPSQNQIAGAAGQDNGQISNYNEQYSTWVPPLNSIRASSPHSPKYDEDSNPRVSSSYLSSHRPYSDGMPVPEIM